MVRGKTAQKVVKWKWLDVNGTAIVWRDWVLNGYNVMRLLKISDVEKQSQMESSSENSGDAGIMENFRRLENRIKYLEHENKEKNKKILELELKSSN